jgi:thymidine kinase
MPRNNAPDPTWKMFVGPMFSSKTTRLIAAIERFQYQNLRVAVFKPDIDDRYDITCITTHLGAKVEATCVNSGKQIIDTVNSMESCDVIAVDEAFMIIDSAEALLDLFSQGKSILVSSLQLSASGKPFKEIKDMMPWATKIEICTAVCPITGRDAYYTHRKTSDSKEILIGGSNIYEPRCFEHYGKLRN